MALLNKFFFPTAITAPTSATAAAPSSSSCSPSSSSSTSSTSAWTTSGSTSAANNKRQNNNQSVHSKNYLSQFPFDGRQVRVLLYRECDSRGRRLLFDSNALQKVPLKETNGNLTKSEKTITSSTEKSSINNNGNKHTLPGKSGHSNGFIEVCDEYGYKHNRPNSTDITSIGEMVFGALAMSFRGTALKVHWLPTPSRILCSQLFLTPMNSTVNSQSPYSTMSMASLATPRTSISSEHGSIDGLSMNSFSMPFSISVARNMSLTPSDRGSLTCPLDVPDQQSLYTINSDSGRTDSGPRYSSTYSNGTDSGYSGLSRGQMSSNDQWSYQYSTRSSLGSVMSEQSDQLRKLSLDSACFPMSPLFSDTSSDGSLQRRICRNLRTSFENEHSMNDIIGFVSDNYPMYCTTSTNGGGGGGSEGGFMGVPNYRRASYCANESRSNPEIGKRRDAATMKQLARRAKLGLAVCITMSESFEEEMELFCSEHIALLEAMLSRLRACTERAYINHKDFLQIMYHAWQDTQQWFNDLFTAPRIKCPVWLSITTSGSKYSKNVAERFIKELCWLLSFADTKDTNFFISTMLTGILTHHLGWVSTVSVLNSATSRSETAAAAIEQRAKLLEVSQKHPYNALWAQMGDLFGAIGMPPKLARTVVYGTEKLSVERLLNILTYFIRCGEVRRSAKREDFNKELINSLVAQNKNETLRKTATNSGGLYSNNKTQGMSGGLKKSTMGIGSGGGLTRTQTCKQNLNTISDNYELSSGGEEEDDEAEISPTVKKNEIPTVLAFRDSRFVQQELRIGNYLMDTGIEKNEVKHAATTNTKDGRIRLTVTTPDNVEMCVVDENAIAAAATAGSNLEDGVLEAIEIDTVDSATPSTDEVDTPNVNRRNFFWHMVPQSVKEGLSLSDLEKLQQGVRLINRKLDRRCSSFSQQSVPDNKMQQQLAQKRTSHLSLSDLITQNSMGKGDRLNWGVEPIKENVSLEEQIHFDFCQKLIEREHGICRQTDNGNGVVFVLGENEPLVNLKRSTEDLAEEPQQSRVNSKPTTQLCALHQRTHGIASHEVAAAKKHSGVKFNFEQYPQIATNYMRSKNLVMSNYDLLMDKCTKLEAQENNASSVNIKASDKDTQIALAADSKTCLVCNSILNCYQTPSNATEMDFEVDGEAHCYPITSTTNERQLHSVSSGASVDTLKSVAANSKTTAETPQSNASPATTKKNTYCSNNKRTTSHRGSTSSVAAKCAAVNEAVHLLKLPVPGIKELPQDDEPQGDMKLRAGFIPSLFLNVSDHYISDMVLQGTCAAPTNWEMSLREDLALAAHSASLISQPAENIAIVADMEKWDVRLISSQSQCFPYAGGQSAPVGMSQLVSSMLETVQAMNCAGISAYECLSFLESKMQEIYLQSETLAAFLLETDFCPLSAVTTALNLSENDVPLLLSIASIHTPQISKKCGISFR